MRELRPMRLAAPDGGWGWAVLAAAIGINFLIPGTIKSFGVLYVEFLRVFEASPSQASWMPALCYFLYSSLGPLTSILAIKYSYRTVALVGGLFGSTGLMISYFAESVTYLYFSYGIMMGIGAGLTFPVTIYIVSEYFDRLRGMATGLCISGSAIGTIVLPPFMQYLLDHVGYRFAVLIIGAILLNTLVCACVFHPVERHSRLVPVEEDRPRKETKQEKEPRVERIIAGELPSSHRSSIVSSVGPVTLDPRRLSRISLSRRLAAKQQQQQQQQHKVDSARSEIAEQTDPADDAADPQQSLFDLRILRDPLYLVILISNSTSAISNTNFMILLPIYAVSQGYDKETSALLLSIVSLLDLIGRIGGASLSDIDLVPKHYYFVGGLGLSGVALALLPMAEGYVYLASFCALFGLSSGLYIGTTAVVLADMLGPERLSSSYGISLFVNGLLQLVGPPLCNLAYEMIGSFKPIFMTLGMILVCGTALWAVLPIIRRNAKQELEKTARAEPAATA
ncbi:monocarboxylate transporter 13 [Nasonia vitripennis]|uniref:Major facilitator superfamily (MFS) profile domain-containing protein n=1 Tax=Nasonia vitripennis TaxID=7425 RepID=A0A7M7LKQ4_NASVI|nr:monocarboxylate transporter 13 [Nasonia vitripennis]